ncbi:MAG: nitrogenase component 1 [Chthoniobacteraceae bacterium]
MSTSYIERSRGSCALHGALATFGAIEGVVPVIHATSGCGVQYQQGVTQFGGATPACAAWGNPLSSSNITEKHVVFGGGSRLREQLKNTVKLLRGDLYVVVTGCATEMVGDDIPAMTKEGREQGWPVIYANTPGFRGSIHRGYELAVRPLIEQLPGLPGPELPPKPGLVNLLGIIPQQDPFWQGHLLGLERIFDAAGLTANPLLGLGHGIDHWRRLPQAALTVVTSPWGRDGAQLLEEKYGTPWIELHGIPVGARATGALLDTLAERLPVDTVRLAAFRQTQEGWFERNLARIAPQYYAEGFQQEFALVGESGFVPGAAEFLVETLGLIPKLVVITDPLAEETRDAWAQPLQRLIEPFGAKLAFAEDAGEIDDLLRASRAELIIGSSLDRPVADELRASFLPVSFPVANRLVLNRGYAGYEGGLAFIEDLGSALLRGRSIKLI